MMNVTFYGAVREVTGSMHLVSTKHDKILLDCGLFQGRRKETAAKNRVLPFDPRMISNMVLSHAHIDHSGRIPLLVKAGFTGQILSTRATVDASEYLLLDSAHIQESDAEYLNYKTVRNALAKTRAYEKGNSELRNLLKKGKHGLNTETINTLLEEHSLEEVKPLYTMKDATASLSCFNGLPYRQPFQIGKDTVCTLYEAGHILGSAVVVLRSESGGRKTTIGFTGDLGRYDKPILRDPVADFLEEDRDIDLLIMESTYGNRQHEAAIDMKEELRAALERADQRGGAVLIPAFAYGRTQELVYLLHQLYDEGAVKPFPVYVDSPLASKITRVFGEHPEVYDRDTHKVFLEKGKNPFSFKNITFVASVEESMALNRDPSPHIVISASGMCEAGRILHHLRYKMHNPATTILIVGFMAAHTLGRRLVEKSDEYEEKGRKGSPPILKVLGKEYPLNAHVEKLNGFSAHGDYKEMLRFLQKSNLSVKRVAVVHGEEEQSLAFCERLQKAGYDAFVPFSGETTPV